MNGTIFKDVRGYGIRTPDAPGLPGVDVRLWHEGSLISTTTSDSSGGYSFQGLDPGSYEVEEVVSEGWTQTLPGCGPHQVTLTDKPAWHLDFGIVPPKPAAISGAAALQPRTLMHFSIEELRALKGAQESMPLAFISPQVKAFLGSSPGESFSLLNYLKYCPADRNQGWCGNCWVWGGTALMEIDLAINKGIKDRLSIEYFTTRFGKVCCGGTLRYLASGYGVLGRAVPWSNANAQWLDGYTSCSREIVVPFNSISATPSYAFSSMEAQRVPTWEVGREEAIRNIKSMLKQNKAVSFAFYLPTDSDWNRFFDFWDNRSESEVFNLDYACGKSWNKSQGAGHMVACVGYDDSDPSNRYWLMVNSWGTARGRPQGLFRLSMDMDYDCQYPLEGDDVLPAFWWDVLNITYPNYPPAIPDRPSGTSQGSTGYEYSYSTSAADPEGNMVRYLFDWGDGTTASTGLVGSGESASLSHAWESPGDYCIRVSASDDQGTSSAQSVPSRIAVRSPVMNQNNIRVGNLKTTGYGNGQATNNVYVAADQRR
ncbi:MAG TPA: SdrD B-like domain-containing protein [Methanotrichaceae archaeon]|nr:SdrD B-like domain-containing protein [Methanotrichaceae archaeon]